MNTYNLSLQGLGKNWGLLCLRGLFAIAFGAAAFAWPGMTLLALALLYGGYAFVDGILSLAAAFDREPKSQSAPTGWLVIAGILGIAAGLLTLFWPGITAFGLVIFYGCWALVRGIFEIAGAMKLRKVIHHEWLLIFSGIVSVLFGAFVMAYPVTGAMTIAWLIGTYSLVFGFLMLALSLVLRSHHLRRQRRMKIDHPLDEEDSLAA